MKKLFAAFAFAAFSIGAKAQDIVDTAIAAGNFKTLVTAVK
ncbi:MAG: fasciclin domain-containing protein, partial [Oxalobacteraceae bacterium]|nr:fasciclin domain-containing protein [Oxalobacteraceae bacterium]